MEKPDYESWFKKFGKAWSNRNSEAAASLFAKNCKYYESVFEAPCKSWNDILNLWLIIPKNQKNITFDFKLLGVYDNICIANWRVARTLLPKNKKQLIDGIFQVSLNEKGLCTFFKQWRTIKKF